LPKAIFGPLPADGTGDTLEALGSSLNQTAARLDRTIRTLTEERNLSSAILGSMVEGVAVVNAAERLVFTNPGFASILGLDVPPVAEARCLRLSVRRNSSAPCAACLPVNHGSNQKSLPGRHGNIFSRRRSLRFAPQTRLAR